MSTDRELLEGEVATNIKLRALLEEAREGCDSLRAQFQAAQAEARKWKRIRTPTHGSCCTCQACGQYYDDCRCDLDDVADELAQTKEKLQAAERERDSCQFELQGLEFVRRKDNQYLLDRIAELEALLRKYGEHEIGCMVYKENDPDLCTCGWSKVEASLEED